MTTPLSLSTPSVGVDAVPGAPDATAPTDAFAALLAALSGAVVVPVATQPVPTEALAPQAETTVAAAPAPAVAGLPHPTAAEVVAAPAPPLPDQPAAPAATAARPAAAPLAKAAPERVEGGRPVLAWDAPAQRAVVPTREEPQVPAATAAAPQLAPAPPEAPAPVVPPVVAPVETPSPVAAAAPAHRTEPTHRVLPAVVEAARGLRHEGGKTSLVVRLDPPELGAVLVRLTVQDGRVDVQLRTPDLAARADLQAQSYDVQQVLRDAGLDLGAFDVRQGDVLSGGMQDGRDQTGTPDRGTPRRSAAADGGPEASHVTDDVADPQPTGTWL